MRQLLLGLLLVGVSCFSHAAVDSWLTDENAAWNSCTSTCGSGCFLYSSNPTIIANSSCQGPDYHYFHVVTSCPAGLQEDPQTFECVEEPDPCGDGNGAPTGSVWDSVSESCQCPDGQTDFFGTDGSYSCIAELDECTSGSDSFMGYVNDQPVCSYEGDCASGEQGGLVNGEWVCLPDACDTGTYVNGSCITPEDTTPEPQETFQEPDSDSDGAPNSNDGDMDGDGTPNSQDDDIDGDGIANADDPSPNNEDQGTATAVGGCDQPPTCTGDDPQECALLKQQWYAMCYTEDYTGGADGFYTPDSADDIGSRIDTAFSDFKDRAQNSAVISGVGNFFEFNAGGACPSYSVSTWVFDLTFDQWCSTEMPWGLISGMILAVSLLVAARIAVS